MTGVLDALYKRLLLAAHPVGSVYQSTVDTSPESLFGGTWEKIEDVFLLAAGTHKAGSTGGEAEHTLSIAELPSHNHRITSMSWGGKGLDHTVNHSYDFWVFDSKNEAPINEGYITKTGSGTPHNNLPPYLAIYMWKRTA